MNKEEFSEIAKIHGQICSLEEMIDTIRNCSPSLGLEIEMKTGSDMGHDIPRRIRIKGDIGLNCFCAIKGVLENSLIEAQKAFEAITINGL